MTLSHEIDKILKELRDSPYLKVDVKPYRRRILKIIEEITKTDYGKKHSIKGE